MDPEPAGKDSHASSQLAVLDSDSRITKPAKPGKSTPALPNLPKNDQSYILDELSRALSKVHLQDLGMDPVQELTNALASTKIGDKKRARQKLRKSPLSKKDPSEGMAVRFHGLKSTGSKVLADAEGIAMAECLSALENLSVNVDGVPIRIRFHSLQTGRQICDSLVIFSEGSQKDMQALVSYILSRRRLAFHESDYTKQQPLTWVFSFEQSFKSSIDDSYLAPQDLGHTDELIIERWNATCDIRPGTATSVKPFKAYLDVLGICHSRMAFHANEDYDITRQVRAFDQLFDNDNKQRAAMTNVYFA
jgi:hypothetical protein